MVNLKTKIRHMDQPLVSCIMPTADRQQYIPLAIRDFLIQDYSRKELIIIDDGKETIASLIPKDERIKYHYSTVVKSTGMKRNDACHYSNGEIIMHWDDDDWHAPDWISQQVYFLLSSGADICGIEHVNFYSTITDTLWRGTALNRNNPYIKGWLNGATLIYSKSFWERNPFKDLQAGEDSEFINTPGVKLYAHEYIDGFIAILHQKNTTRKYFENPLHKKSPF